MAADNELFEEIAELFEARAAERSTMMGFPCLRRGGEFFVSCHHQTGDLIVKLPSARVDELISSGVGDPFAPAGRRFREWATITERNFDLWQELTTEAYEFAAQ